METGYVEIPNDLYQFHMFVTLTEYFMFVNGVPFMTTAYIKNRLFNAENIPSHTAYYKSTSLSKIVKICDPSPAILLE